MSSTLRIGRSVQFDVGLMEREVVVLESDTMDVRQGDDSHGIDGVWINYIDSSGDTVLHISFRRRRNQIIFNCRRNGQEWGYGLEERIPLLKSLGYFRSSMLTSIGCSYDGRYYDIYLNAQRAFVYRRHFGDDGPIVRLEYGYHDGSERRSVFSDELVVRRFSGIGSWLDDGNSGCQPKSATTNDDGKEALELRSVGMKPPPYLK
jgi:hypothetical protein